jgi:hypothetical protein
MTITLCTNIDHVSGDMDICNDIDHVSIDMDICTDYEHVREIWIYTMALIT